MKIFHLGDESSLLDQNDCRMLSVRSLVHQSREHTFVESVMPVMHDDNDDDADDYYATFSVPHVRGNS